MRKEDVIIPKSVNDSFDDLKEILKANIPEKYRHIVFDSNPLDTEKNPTIGKLTDRKIEWVLWRIFDVINLSLLLSKYSTYLEEFQLSISQNEMYPEDDWIVQKVLTKLATFPIISACKFYNNFWPLSF